MAEVILNEVCKRYEGGALAVDRFTLTVSDGEFLVLVGPSGCGKSTTLRMIAGLEAISSGTISIAGRCVNAVPPKDRDIAMVFQNYALYPHMTVFENMAFGLKLRGLPRREIAERVGEAADILGLQALLRRLPKQLSGGQRQRVAVGRAIVRKPKVFLFDEPLSNLDAKMRVEMRAEISRLHRRLKATMVYVTHDQTEAMTMGDRIVVMNGGAIQQVAAPLEVYRRPANLFVAGFIGTPRMNVLRGRLARENGGLVFRCAACDFRVPDSQAKALAAYADRDVSLGFRPEAADAPVTDERRLGGASACCARLSGTIDAVEPMGAETYLQIMVAGGATVIARVAPERAVSAGTSVVLPVSLEQAVFFDGVTGAAVGAP